MEMMAKTTVEMVRSWKRESASGRSPLGVLRTPWCCPTVRGRLAGFLADYPLGISVQEQEHHEQRSGERLGRGKRAGGEAGHRRLLEGDGEAERRVRQVPRPG